jgi:glucose-6-phosphate 1-epimerase
VTVRSPAIGGEAAEMVAGPGSLPKLRLAAADGATAEIYLHGAHVVSWRPAPDGEERLYLSGRSELRAGAAIRGGIPVIFPQFAAEGPLVRHGFARTSEWILERAERLADGSAVADLTLSASDATRRIWPAEFLAELRVHVGGSRLVVGLAVENVGTARFAFTCALHTYLRVHDVGDVEVLGLQGTRYRESGAPGVLRPDGAETIRIAGEVDRVYVNAPREVTMREGARCLRVSAETFPDLVLWNPGATRAAALSDLDEGGERRMLCIEAAAVQAPVSLSPGAKWHGTQTLEAPSPTSPEVST